MSELPIGEYGWPGPMRDGLVAAILAGEKTSTTSLLADYAAEGEPLPQVGDREAVIDSAGKVVCVIRVTGVRVLPFKKVDLAHARAEGEGFEDVASWQEAHAEFFGIDLSSSVQVVCVTFQLEPDF